MSIAAIVFRRVVWKPARGGYHKNRSGFTIVELLIVIVVIGILAAITTVAYSGIQDRSRNTVIKDGASKFVTALKLWSVQTGKTPLQTGGGWGSGGSGWVSTQIYDATYYPIATETVLRTSGYLSTDFTKNLPMNDSSGYTYSGYTLMLYDCGGTGQFVVYYSLFNPSSSEQAQFATVNSQCGASPGYGMDGGIVFS